MMATSVISSNVNDSHLSVIHIYNRSLIDGVTVVIALASNVAITIIGFCLLAACLVVSLYRYLRRREVRDKLCKVIANQYWISEDHIAHVVRLLKILRKVIIFRDVSAYHVLSYKYRFEDGVYGSRVSRGVEKTLLHSYVATADVFQILKKVERLFDSLLLQLTCKGKCPQHIANAFSATLNGLVEVTSLIWSDRKARGVRHLVQYFAGQAATEAFDSLHISDADLETLVVTRVPYVGQLYFNFDHFVLKDCEIPGGRKIELASKIRYIDTVLAKEGKILQAKEKSITESYYAARELCLKNGFIQTKSHFPDVSKFSDGEHTSEYVVNLRHLLRLMCMSANVQKIENDDKFFQLLMQLHEALYSWIDEHTMIEVIERCRNNIVLILHGLTVEQILSDREFTKAKLEQLEKELYRHLNYLTIRQVQQEKRQLHDRLKEAGDGNLRPADSESSVYTMALSTSSYAMKQHHLSQERPGAEGSRMLHQQSVDQGSIASGSSLYATATLLSSFNEALIPSSRVSPSSQKLLIRTTSDTNGEMFETPV